MTKTLITSANIPYSNSRKKYNLNLLSHDSAMMLIQQVIDAGVKVKKVFLDTVGPEKKYEDKLKAKFPNVEFKVSKKADSLYTVVSASSICAKVIRDRIVCNWPFPDHDVDRDYGSGYPAGNYYCIIYISFSNISLITLFQIPRLKHFCTKILTRSLDFLASLGLAGPQRMKLLRRKRLNVIGMHFNVCFFFTFYQLDVFFILLKARQ